MSLSNRMDDFAFKVVSQETTKKGNKIAKLSPKIAKKKGGPKK